ncbi:hypothetical protein ACJMK2_022733, partial [Sinanodonta woodiana]
FLASKYKESRSAGDGYLEFHQKVKKKIAELKSAGTTKSFTASGYRCGVS